MNTSTGTPISEKSMPHSHAQPLYGSAVAYHSITPRRRPAGALVQSFLAIASLIGFSVALIIVSVTNTSMPGDASSLKKLLTIMGVITSIMSSLATTSAYRVYLLRMGRKAASPEGVRASTLANFTTPGAAFKFWKGTCSFTVLAVSYGIPALLLMYGAAAKSGFAVTKASRPVFLSISEGMAQQAHSAINFATGLPALSSLSNVYANVSVAIHNTPLPNPATTSSLYHYAEGSYSDDGSAARSTVLVPMMCSPIAQDTHQATRLIATVPALVAETECFVLEAGLNGPQAQAYDTASAGASMPYSAGYNAATAGVIRGAASLSVGPARMETLFTGDPSQSQLGCNSSLGVGIFDVTYVRSDATFKIDNVSQVKDVNYPQSALISAGNLTLQVLSMAVRDNLLTTFADEGNFTTFDAVAPPNIFDHAPWRKMQLAMYAGAAMAVYGTDGLFTDGTTQDILGEYLSLPVEAWLDYDALQITHRQWTYVVLAMAAVISLLLLFPILTSRGADVELSMLQAIAATGNQDATLNSTLSACTSGHEQPPKGARLYLWTLIDTDGTCRYEWHGTPPPLFQA